VLRSRVDAVACGDEPPARASPDRSQTGRDRQTGGTDRYLHALSKSCSSRRWNSTLCDSTVRFLAVLANTWLPALAAKIEVGAAGGRPDLETTGGCSRNRHPQRARSGILRRGPWRLIFNGDGRLNLRHFVLCPRDGFLHFRKNLGSHCGTAIFPSRRTHCALSAPAVGLGARGTRWLDTRPPELEQ